MIRQHFVVRDGTTWACGGCGAVFLDGWVEHPATCPMMRPVECKHELVLESCTECYPAAALEHAGKRLPPALKPSQVTPDSWQAMSWTAEDHQARRRYGPWIVATYEGSMCPDCGQRRIRAGDYIRADDELGDFVCKPCGMADGGPDPEES